MARSADALSYAAAVSFVYTPGIPGGALRPDDRAVREIEEALRIAERSGDDLALALAWMTLGFALVHRPTDAERDRGHTFLAEACDWMSRWGYLMCELPVASVYLAVSGLDVGVAMPPSRSSATPSTSYSGTDSRCGAFLRPVFWWRRCSIGGPTVTWPKPRLRSSG